MNRIKRRLHCLFERFVNLFFRPEERILILDPFVITHSDATRIRKNVRHQEDALIRKHSIGAGRGWAIRQLSDDLRFNLPDVAIVIAFSSAEGNRISQSTVNTSSQAISFTPRSPASELVCCFVSQCFLDVDSVFGIKPDFRIAHRDHFRPIGRHHVRDVRSGVSKAMNRDTRAVKASPPSRDKPRASV